MNNFELFEIPVSFTPDLKLLKQKFYALSRKFHPDFYTQENDFEQSDALEKSSQINKAFKIFQSRDETIKYVLQLKGLVEEEEKYELSPLFLMEMLELNEQLMEAKMEQRAEALVGVADAIAGIKHEIYEPVKSIVESYQEGTTTTEQLLKVKEYYYKKKYLNRILAPI